MKPISHSRKGPNTFPGILAGTVAALLLSACAATVDRSDVVIDRAKARWEAVVSEDYSDAYTYLSPGFRSSVSSEDYELDMRKRRITFSGADYVSHDCEENRCTISFQVEYGVVRPLPGVGTWENKKILVEKWVRTEGNWWYLPEGG